MKKTSIRYKKYTMADSDARNYSEIPSSEEPSVQSSANPSRPGSAGGERQPVKKSRVRFNSEAQANDGTNRRSYIPSLEDFDFEAAGISIPKETKAAPSQSSHSRTTSATGLLKRTPDREKEDPFADVAGTSSPVNRPRPSIVKSNPSYERDEDVGGNEEKAFSALAAQERAQRVASLVGSHSAPSSRRNSVEDEDEIRFARGGQRNYPVRVDDIPLMDMDSRRTYDGADSDEEKEKLNGQAKLSATSEAHKLVRAHTRKDRSKGLRMPAEPAPGLVSGQVTPTDEQTHSEEYVPRPEQYRGGVLSSLLKLYNPPQDGLQQGHGHSRTVSGSPSHNATPGSSGTT